MIEPTEYKEEILKQFALHDPDLQCIDIDSFKKVLGGADTTIFGFDLRSTSETIPLILRIYRPQYSSSAKREFAVMKNLYDEGIYVPRPFFCVEKSEVSGFAYIVMERIDGILLSDALSGSISTPRFDFLLDSFIRNLVAINSVDWRENLRFLDHFDIEKNPHLFLEHQISRPKRIINEHAIEMLVPVITWFENNQPELDNPCLLHSDYHGMNVLVRDDDSLVTIDWATAKLGDFRFDLGFSILALGSMVKDISGKLLGLYETISGRKIQNIDYFIALSGLWNLLRCYSCVYDHQITGENQDTANLFAGEYSDYSSTIIRNIQVTTGATLTKLGDDLRRYSSQSNL